MSRRRPPARRRAAAAAGVLVAVALCAGLLAPDLAPAAAAGSGAAPAAPLTVTVDAMSPAAAHDGSTLTLQGTIRNTGSTPATDLQLVVGVGSAPDTRGGLLRDFTAPPGIADILDECADCLGAVLAPGAAESYRLSVPLGGQLDRGVVRVYPLAVRVVGDVGTGGGQDLGEGDTFLPYVPGAVDSALRVSWLVPLDPAPALDAAGAVTTSAFPAAIDAGGSVAALLAAGAPPAGTRADGGQPGYAPVTYAVEPSLLGAAQRTATAGWRRSSDPAGSPVRAADPGSAAFLGTLAARTRGHGVVALPYGDPDAVAVTRAGLGLDVSGAVATARADVAAALPAADLLTGVGWLPGGAVDQASLDTYAAAGVTTLVLPGDQLTPSITAFPPTQTAVTTLPTQGPTLGALVTDPDVQALLAAGGHDAPTPRMAAERLLAVLALTLGEAPNAAAVRDVVLALPRGTVPAAGWLTDVLADTGSVPWLRAVPLGSLVGDPPSARTALASYPPSARAEELPQSTLVGGPASVATLRQGVDDLGSTLPVSALTHPLDLALVRAESFAWRADPAGGEQLRSGVAQRTGQVLGGIRLAAATTVTLASRNASIPVTVENSLGEPAHVRVSLTSNDRTKVGTSTRLVTVPAGRKLRVLLPATTQRAGTFRATVVLATVSGRTITTVPVTVHSRAYGGLTVGITLGAVGVLLVAIVVRAARRLRGRSRRRAAATS